MKNKITILFPCAGRRVSLLKSFRKAAKKLGLSCVIVGTDKDDTSAALQCCDHKHIVSTIKSKNYFKDSLAVIKKYKVDLVVPTLDTDLHIWSKHRAMLKKMGCTVLISTASVIKVCQDKRLTGEFLTKYGFDTPKLFDLGKLLKNNGNHFPYFLKPWDGSAARGSQKVNNQEELRFYSSRIPNCLVQSYTTGKEFTIDSMVDFDGEIRCIVPRERLEVRGGEVVKGITVKNEMIIEQTYNMLKKLKAGPGVITTQCFLTKENKVKFIEINPRFGGGVPLSIKAGADFPKWILAMVAGQKIDIPFCKWRENLLMMRYDSEVWKKL